MKLSVFAKTFTALSIALLVQMASSAHTGLKESTPANEATVTASPGHIDLVFTAEVRLIKFEVMGVGHEMPSKFEAGTEAMASYRIETPGMHPGQFTINWAVIGEDGHTVANSFSFLVDPDAEEAHGHSHGEGGDHDAGHGEQHDHEEEHAAHSGDHH